MAVIIDNTIGTPTANSYVSASEAETYLSGRLYATAWDDADEDVKNRALITATRTIDIYMRWLGYQSIPGTQRLMWPRTGMYYANGYTIVPVDVLPENLKAATIELAFRLVQNGKMPDTPAETQGIEAFSVGSLSFDFSATTYAGMTEYMDAYVLGLLAPWGIFIGPGANTLNVPLVRF